MPSFDAFHQSLHGCPPFPWQSRLAAQVAKEGRWPQEIGVPTGMGKTACLDIALWSLASQAGLPKSERTAPTRIWWVVNRRLLVDSTWERAERIAKALEKAGGGTALGGISRRLAALSACPNPPPLEVVRLRGGVTARLPSDASQPAILLSTLPMYGSRLLFRGFGVSRGMRPIWAALAGCDSLVLLDEAHLAPHLTALVKAAGECFPARERILAEGRDIPQVVSLTATGRGDADERFTLDAADKANPIVRKRLCAAKRLSWRDCDEKRMAREMAEAAKQCLDRLRRPAAGIIFANTPKIAREVFNILKKSRMHKHADIVLLTGRTREREAVPIRCALQDSESGMGARPGGGCTRSRTLIAVATQTLEVGADLDADFLVSESCGVRALTQRLGRLNRLGHRADAVAEVLHGWPSDAFRECAGEMADRRATVRLDNSHLPDDPKPNPVYGLEVHEVRRRLGKALGLSPDGELDVSPLHVGNVLGAPEDHPGRAPELLPGLLWEWIKTTTPPEGEAPVELFFSGVTENQSRTASVIWRAHIPEPGERLWPRVRNDESVEIPMHELQEALERDEQVVILERQGRVDVEKIPAANLRSGDILILPTDGGLLDEWGWNPTKKASSVVVDASLADRGLPLDVEAINRVLADVEKMKAGWVDQAAAVANESDDAEAVERARQEAVEEIISFLAASPLPSGWSGGGDAQGWRNFIMSLSAQVQFVKHEVPRLPVRAESAGVENERDERDEESDERSLADKRVELEQHGQDVGARAAAAIESLGMQSILGRTVEMAAKLHDIGKADDRFQRWLAPEDHAGGLMLAKSDSPRHQWATNRVKAGWPKGGRHETLSARLAEAWLADPSSVDQQGARLQADLLVHLVVSHHGFGRPLIAPVQDGTPAEVRGMVNGRPVSAPADLSIVDWEQPSRFRRLNERFGPWGLALLETIVRLSDFAASKRRAP